jgi:hypothetical protein
MTQHSKVIPELNDGELSVIQHLKKKALNVQKVAVALAMKEMVQTYVELVKGGRIDETSSPTYFQSAAHQQQIPQENF